MSDVDYERLVLTACHPLYSAAQRIVAFAASRTSACSAPASRSWQDPERAGQARSEAQHLVDHPRGSRIPNSVRSISSISVHSMPATAIWVARRIAVLGMSRSRASVLPPRTPRLGRLRRAGAERRLRLRLHA